MDLDLLVSEYCIARFPVIFEEERWLSETDTIDDDLSFCKLKVLNRWDEVVFAIDIKNSPKDEDKPLDTEVACFEQSNAALH
jgi:hypothetical protein